MIWRKRNNKKDPQAFPPQPTFGSPGPSYPGQHYPGQVPPYLNGGEKVNSWQGAYPMPSPPMLSPYYEPNHASFYQGQPVPSYKAANPTELAAEDPARELQSDARTLHSPSLSGH
jgi:hypothetical protein